MHLFHSRDNSRVPMLRAHARFDLPLNPVCWALGHRAGVELIESRFASMKAWVKVECRVCGRRYQPDRKWETSSSVLMRAERQLRGETVPARTYTGAELYKLEQELQAEAADRYVEFARRDPAQLAASASGRDGYGGATLELNAELVWRGLKGLKAFGQHAGFRLHTGGRGSETPLDAHVDVGLAAGYFSVGGVGHRWCELIGRGHGRDLSLSLHGGQLWWKLWYDGDGGNDEHHDCDSWRQPALWPWSAGRRKHRGWMCLRSGNIELNPVSAFWGSPKFLLADRGEPRQALVRIGQFPGDEYLVTFRLDYREVQREHGPRWARRVQARYPSVEFDAVIRSPDKGDEVCSGNLRSSCLEGWDPSFGEDWLPRAVQELVDDVLRDRVRYGFRAPEPATP